MRRSLTPKARTLPLTDGSFAAVRWKRLSVGRPCGVSRTVSLTWPNRRPRRSERASTARSGVARQPFPEYLFPSIRCPNDLHYDEVFHVGWFQPKRPATDGRRGRFAQARGILGLSPPFVEARDDDGSAATHGCLGLRPRLVLRRRRRGRPPPRRPDWCQS